MTFKVNLYVKNYPNLSQFFFIGEYQFRSTFFVIDIFWHFLLLTFIDIFKSLYFLKWCPIFDTSPLTQFSKLNNFLWVCWFLGKNLFDFVPPLENFTTYIAISIIQNSISIEFTISDTQSFLSFQPHFVLHNMSKVILKPHLKSHQPWISQDFQSINTRSNSISNPEYILPDCICSFFIVFASVHKVCLHAFASDCVPKGYFTMHVCCNTKFPWWTMFWNSSYIVTKPSRKIGTAKRHLLELSWPF